MGFLRKASDILNNQGFDALDKILYAICNDLNLCYGNYSNLIQDKFGGPEEDGCNVLQRIVSLESGYKSNDDLSKDLAIMNEAKNSSY
jgi:hypothetical protein